MEHLIPSRLYGEALRYYESLDPECQQDYEQVRDALTQRFPGTIRNDGITQHATVAENQSWLSTPAEAPPLTSPQLALPLSVAAGPGGSDVKPTEKVTTVDHSLSNAGSQPLTCTTSESFHTP
ncbi:hypothetical protein FS837_012618 [Tulasnella sp. UAMH 9824]|nr:hypothetical protein FS837_012618 [Tulasnella sp. UAMH 9824]